MKRYTLVGLLFFFLSSSITAQSFEIGPQIGGMIYTGDLDPQTFSEQFQNLEFAFGAHLKYNINPYFAIRANFSKGNVSGRDSISNADWQKRRNLSFESGITEFSLMIENNLFGFDISPGSDKIFTLHAFAGIAVYKFNPRALYNGQYIDLQPLGTEGQGLPGYGEKYSLTQLAVPLGAGLKFKLTDRISVGMEMSGRFLFTDYLDDVSGTYVAYEELQAGNGSLAANLAKRESEFTGIDIPYSNATGDIRGKSDVNDYYLSGMVTFSYHFDGAGIFTDKNKIGCPTF